MEKMKKVLKGNKAAAIISLVCIIALAVSVPKTISYLSASSEKVVNTFAAGAISLTLDEAKVDGNGQETDDSRVTENTYKIVPGRTLDKDPTVTVLEGSEVCYVFLYVDDPLSLGTYADYFTVDYSSDWIKAAESGTASIYVYKTTVDASEDDVELPAIFTQIKISIDLTSEQAAALEGTEITVKAYAVQTENITLEDALAFAEEYFADEFAEDGSTITWTSSGNTVSVAGAWTESADDESTEESGTEAESESTSEESSAEQPEAGVPDDSSASGDEESSEDEQSGETSEESTPDSESE